MHKAIKYTLITIALLIVLAIAGIAALVSTINPNNYKTKITEQVSEHTGLTVAINGDMGWSVFPWIALEVKNVVINNPPQYGKAPMANIGVADVRIKLLPLLMKKIEVGRVILKDSTFNLVNRQSKWNWQSVAYKPSSSTTPAPTTAGSSFDIAVTGVDISNTTVNITNITTGDKLSISNLNLSTDRSGLGNTISTKLDANIKADNMKSPVNFSLKGDMLLGDNALTVSDMSLSMAELKVTGDLTATQLNTAPHFKGKLAISPFNPKKLLSAFGQSASQLTHLAASLSVNGTANDFTANPIKVTLNDNTLSGNIRFKKISTEKGIPYALSGKLSSPKLGLGDVAMTTVNIALGGQSNNLKLAPITANLFQGSLNATTQINLQQKTPNYAATMALNNVNIASLLKALNKPTIMSGLLDTTSNLQIRGTALNTLNGNGKFNVNKGVLYGINIQDQLQKAVVSINKNAQVKKTSENTNFQVLSGSYTINAGVMNNNNFYAKTDMLEMRGSGTVNLNNEAINYRLNVTAYNPNIGRDVMSLQDEIGGSFPVVISGTLSNPKATPDLAAIAAGVAKNQIKKHIKNGVGDALDKLDLNKIF